MNTLTSVRAILLRERLLLSSVFAVQTLATSASIVLLNDPEIIARLKIEIAAF